MNWEYNQNAYKIPEKRCAMAVSRKLIYLVSILLVISAAWAARWHALDTLNIDYDEDDYMRAAQEFTTVFRSGDLGDLLETNYRPEHPPLAKILMGLALLGDPERPTAPDRPTSSEPNRYLPLDLLKSDRTLNAALGTLTVAMLAVVSPLAGLLLAVHAWTIKYVSQVMLEAVPAFTSMACVMTYLLWKRQKRRRFSGWLVVSALFLGLSAASKYLYAFIGLAVAADWLLDELQEGEARKIRLGTILAWGLLAVAIFFAFNPYLWPDPVNRLRESLLYHTAYSQGATEVQSSNYPVWQQLNWLAMSPRVWQKNAFYLALDPLLAILAAFGLGRLWKKYRVFALWLGIVFFFLLIWPTKWPQYLVTLSVPLMLASSEGLQLVLINPIRDWVAGRKERQTRVKAKPARNQVRQALPWLLPGLLAFAIFTILPLFFQAGVALTDFSSTSLRDGLNGGLWREIYGGLTGGVKATLQQFPFRSTTVHYLGFDSFAPVMDYLSQDGVMVTDILWTVLSVGLQLSLGLLAALLLWQRGIRFKRGWQALFILPWAIPEMIGALMWWNVLAPETGWLALAARQFGPTMPFSFLLGWEKSSSIWLVILLIAGVWYGFPFMMLAASAGLKMLPVEVYDAVQMDGASAGQTFRYVTWPLLAPLVIPAIIVRGIFAFNQFYLFQTFGVWDGTLATLSYNFFNTSGFQINGQFAISAVINILTVIILMGFIILFNRLSRADEGVSYA